MRIYPDVYGRRFLWMSVDLLLVGWVAAWVLAGRWVDQLVLKLDVLAQGVIGAGRTFNNWLISLEQAIPTNVPFVSDAPSSGRSLRRRPWSSWRPGPSSPSPTTACSAIQATRWRTGMLGAMRR